MPQEVTNEIHLEVAAALYALHLQEIGDRIVSKSWKTSEAITEICKSSQIVSASIEICACFIHDLSRNLPIIEGDCLNELVYGPTVRYCSRELGDLVEQLQDARAFSIAVYSGDVIEAEMLHTIETRDLEYSEIPYMNVPEHASRIITNLAGETSSALSFVFTHQFIVDALIELDLAGASKHLQEALTPDLITYLRKTESNSG